MAEPAFRELHGDYVANAGQVINLREYLDYYEPLGSALSRLPDGSGGPFMHSFTDSGGRTIGSMGWVVSAASKRFGGWKLWGTWSNRAIPAAALPLFWPELSDPARVSNWVGRANEEAERLLDRGRWPELFDEVNTKRLHDAALREALKVELARAYAVPPPYRHPLEVEVTPRTLDILPWLYLLGPVDPATAQLQPSRFNGAGYQYILSDDARRRADVEITDDVDVMVDRAADDVVEGWQLAGELRARRARPPVRRSKEVIAVPQKKTTVSSPSPATAAMPPAWIADWVYRVLVIALLAWIGINLHLIRTRPVDAPIAALPTPTATPTATVPDRIPLITDALATKPLPRIVMSEGLLKTTTTSDALAVVAVEIFIRRNACYDRTVAVDGKFSAAEQRAMRTCAPLREERLLNADGTPDEDRALAWLERVTSNAR